jgi:hypothetical protein
VQLGCDEGEEFGKVCRGPFVNAASKRFIKHWKLSMASKVCASLDPSVGHAATVAAHYKPHGFQ